MLRHMASLYRSGVRLTRDDYAIYSEYVETPELLVATVTDWRRWLEENWQDEAEVWLILAKKGIVEPTSLTYDQALEEALCFGWIDSQLAKRDAATYRQRFTPRKPRSPWSLRNTSIVSALLLEGRMHEAGIREVERAKADGRWDVAYAGQSTIEVPEDLALALAANPEAAERFNALKRSDRFSILYRLSQAKRPETRQRHITKAVTALTDE